MLYRMMLSHLLITLLALQCGCAGVINNQGALEFIYKVSQPTQDTRNKLNQAKEEAENIRNARSDDFEERPVVITSSDATKLCTYKERYYKPGETHVTDCVTCQCKAGLMSCTVTTCPTSPECIRYEPVPGRCCPECVEWGCFHEGVGYPRGARIPTPSCQVCYCPWHGGTGGKARCSRVTCPPAQCVDGKVPAGKCCPVCLHGKFNMSKS